MDMDYNKFKEKIFELTGYDLNLYKKDIFIYIEADFSKFNVKNYNEYYNLIENNLDIRNYFLTHLTCLGSDFFRDGYWDIIRIKVLPDLYKTFGKDNLNIWCASCATGEEVYSLMCLTDGLPVLATDLNENSLKKCKYPPKFRTRLFREVPLKYQHYLQEDNGSFIQRFSDNITIQKLDLLYDEYPQNQHLILCRNIIKWFERKETIPKVKQKLIDSLVIGGYLFVGTDKYEKLDPSIYPIKEIAPYIYQKI